MFSALFMKKFRVSELVWTRLLAYLTESLSAAVPDQARLILTIIKVQH